MRRNVSRSLAVSVIRSGIPQSYPGDGEGRQEICIHGGMGLPGLGGGDPKKPLVTEPGKMCFACHTPQKANDYTFSTYLH